MNPRDVIISNVIDTYSQRVKSGSLKKQMNKKQRWLIFVLNSHA